MEDKKEAKRLMKFAKKILDRRSIKNLKKVGEEDKIEAIEYAMRARLEREYIYLKEKAGKMERMGKDTFFIQTQLSLLASKMRLFNTTHHKADFINMANLFKQTEKEMRNVQSI